MENCNSCNKNSENKAVPYIVYESESARHERTVKRFIIALIVAFALLFASNVAWLYAWMQYDYSSEEIVVDAQDGTANYIGHDGDINNGTNNGQEENED